MYAVFPAPGAGHNLRRSCRLSHKLKDDSTDCDDSLFDDNQDSDKKRTRTDRKLFQESSDEEDHVGEKVMYNFHNCFAMSRCT